MPNINSTVNSYISNIAQFDGLDNVNLSSSDNDLSESENSNVTDYVTDDEIDPEMTPISITPASKPSKNKLKILKASSLPLITVMNARSLYNKPDNFKTFLNELGIEVAIVSESWEREDKPLDNLLNLTNYKIHSYRREKVKANKQPGGSCAIIYNEIRFKVTKLDIHVPKGVEACWVILKPLDKSDLMRT